MARPSEPHNVRSSGADLEAVIFGMMDGLVTNLALVAGVVAAAASLHYVIVAAVAAMFAGGFSMFVGAYVSSRARFELGQRELARERHEVDTVPEIERAETREILQRWGLPEGDQELVLANLTKDKELWVRIMMRDELGFSDEDLERPPRRQALLVGVSFLAGAVVPLFAFAVGPLVSAKAAILDLFVVAVILSAGALVGLGAFKERFGGQRPWYGALQMLVIGLGAAGAVYLLTSLVLSL